MRKREKELVAQMISVLDEAHKEIQKLLSKNEAEAACALLAECQNTAISLGTLIEQSEGIGFKTVTMLEDYCELLYQSSEKIVSCEANAKGIYKALNGKLSEIELSSRYDIPLKKEVVFLPYKASMWDSLESVWKKADADPNTDAYVIPIPYFDKNPDGSFKEMHCEADLYPDYVPITKYEDYDFGKRHPDEIYIHNPYDDCNFVTSVHPFFYSDKLKPHTDKLIYIPYFVLAEPSNVENYEAHKGIEHFILNKAVINCDQVIVQSEAMRKVYITVLTHNYGEETRKYWEEKILGTGSPKFDRIRELRKEDLTLPDTWAKLIKKPDGTFKKIIFYNTSVTAMIREQEQMIEKIKDVLRIFKEDQDELTLLWRPHPLMQSTIESMLPQLWQDYKAIVDSYIAEGWGIYDDTPSMDLAIAYSDAYYGDGSSIVQLYQQTGKPIMIQNASVIDGDYE